MASRVLLWLSWIGFSVGWLLIAVFDHPYPVLGGILLLSTSLLGFTVSYTSDVIQRFYQVRRVAQTVEEMTIAMLQRVVVIFMFWFTLVSGFAGIYLGILKRAPSALIDDAGALGGRGFFQELGNCLYYSVITIATVGYGDIKPAATGAGWWVKGACTLEIGLAIFWFTFFLAVLFSSPLSLRE